MIPMLLVAQMLIVHAPPPPPQAEAIRILRESPGLSNWTNRPVIEPEEDRWRGFVPTTPTVAPQPIEQRRLDGTPLSQPPTVYGIPYPYDPLSWAILNCCQGNTGPIP